MPLEQIHANPRQPRKRFDHEATAGLADSIRAQGVVQPVVLRPRLEGGYELIAGERRWRAAREAGIPTVPAVIREADDRDTLLLGLIENVAREDLSPVEEARGYALLMDEFELSLGDVAERVGRSKPAVSNKTRLLELPDDVLAMVERGELSEGHARAVLAVPDQTDRRRLARKIVSPGHVGASRRARGPLVGRAHEAEDEDAGRSGARGTRAGGASPRHRPRRAGRAGPGRARLRRRARPRGARRAPRVALRRGPGRWAIVDSNHGPPPYQSGALTN